MPAGPSHNRSGGSSGFSGGSHHTSHRSGGFSPSPRIDGGFEPHPMRPIRFRFFGSNVVVSTGKQSLLIFMIILLCFSAFGIFITAGIKNTQNDEVLSLKAYIAQTELDAVWYANAKDKAEAGTDENFFIAYATEYLGIQKFYYNANSPTGYYYDNEMEVRLNNIPYFYLIYTYTTPDGVTHEGETYSSFTSSEAAGWDRKIIVGKDNGSWASINYDYSLSTNKEYLFIKQQLSKEEDSLKTVKGVFAGMIIATIVIAALTVWIIVVTIKKGKKEYVNEQEKIRAEIDKKKAEAGTIKSKNSQINRICMYCGGAVPDGENKCPSCGSTKFKK